MQRAKDKSRRSDDSSDEDSDDSNTSRGARRAPFKSRNDDAREEQEVLRALIGGVDPVPPASPVKRGRGRPRKYPRPEEISATEARRRADEQAMARELDALEAGTGASGDSEADQVEYDDLTTASPSRSEVRAARPLPPPPAPKLFSFQPSPAMFAAKKLRGPVMVLREEISDVEEVEEEEEDVDRMEIDDVSLEWERPPVVAWMPQEQDDPSARHHNFVRRPDQRTGLKRSHHTSSDDDNRSHGHSQVTVQRTFGLWRPGNPEGFASEKRRLDPSVDVGEEEARWITKQARGNDSPEGTPPPPTPKSKDLYTSGVPSSVVSRLDLYQRPRSHSVGNMLLQRELEAATRRAAADALRRPNPSPLVKSRLQHPTYTNQTRSHVKLPSPLRGLVDAKSMPRREEESWLKAQPRRISSRSLSPGPADDLWSGQRQKSMISLPLYNSDGEDVDLDINEAEYDVEGENILGAHGELDIEEIFKADSDESMQSEVETPTKVPRRSSRRVGKGSLLDIPVYSQLDEDGIADPGSNERVLEGSSPLAKLRQREQVSHLSLGYLPHNSQTSFLPSISIG